MACEGNVVYPDVLSCTEVADDRVVVVGFLVVLHIEVSDNDVAVKATLKGDADLSGEVDLADLTTVAKFNLNNELYPLANETAFANADMNSDGEVNGVDTSALIENQLGK